MNENRENRKGLRTILIIIALVILGVLAWFVIKAEDKAEKDKEFTFECNAERVEYINRLGYIVEPDPESKKVTVPAEFNETYESYNELQKSQGFDLAPYKGVEITMYTYNVLNYPDIPENVKLNLLFDDHRLIGGDITYEDAENGFTKAFSGDASLQTTV